MILTFDEMRSLDCSDLYPENGSMDADIGLFLKWYEIAKYKVVELDCQVSEYDMWSLVRFFDSDLKEYAKEIERRFSNDVLGNGGIEQ